MVDEDRMRRTRAAWTLIALLLGSLAASCGGGGNPILAIPNPELTLVKTANPTTFAALNDVIGYSFAVTNTGDQSLVGPITIDDDTATDESCPALATVGNNDNLLDPGETIVCSATHTITQADLTTGSVTNTATASATDPGGATVTSNPDQATVTGPLVAVFTADPPSAGQRVNMEPGAPSSDAEFEVTINAVSLTDLYGAAFTLLYDPTKATYLGCDAAGSILTSSVAGSIPCDDALVGGAKFKAELQVPGALLVRASKDGLVPGDPTGSGLLLTLTFEASIGIPPPGEPFTFESGPSREVQICPADDPLPPCTTPQNVAWDGGKLIAVGG
jgi:hypothetical protein